MNQKNKGCAVAEECIHGLDAGQCDVCYPKPVPAVDPDAAKQRAARPRVAAGTSPRRTAPGAGPARTPAAKARLDNVGEQRIYHVTHMSNLADILSSGALRADESASGSTHPIVDISSAENRQARRNTLVAGTGSLSVASFVPFFLAPNAAVWQGVRTGSADPRLSPAIRGTRASEFVILVSTVKHVIDWQADGESTAVVTNGDATHVLTRFGATRGDSESMLRRLRSDEDSDAILAAEYLVPESLPFELVTLVGVAHDKARSEAKGILQSSAFSPKVAVYPPWFAKPA
jgi:hypothetical protein